MSYFLNKPTQAHYAVPNNLLALNIYDKNSWDDLNYCPSYFQKPCLTSINDWLYATESCGTSDNPFRVTICRLDASFLYNQWEVL